MSPHPPHSPDDESDPLHAGIEALALRAVLVALDDNDTGSGQVVNEVMALCDCCRMNLVFMLVAGAAQLARGAITAADLPGMLADALDAAAQQP